MNVESELHKKYLSENMKSRDHLRILDVDIRTVLEFHSSTVH